MKTEPMKIKPMKIKFLALTLMLVAYPILGQDYQVPKTAEGLPDISGVWNYNDSTPLERPARYGDREFLTEEEISQRRVSVQGRQQAMEQREEGLSERVVEEGYTDPGAYNAFWLDTAEPYTNIRTSLVVYPENGRLPPLVDEVMHQRSPPSSTPCGSEALGKPRPIRISWGALGCEHPEEFGLASRCIFFPHTGPPHTRGTSYNNNIRIIQTKDHVVINTEMGNDPRIIPLDGRPRLDERLTYWAGSSRGHFEGDTLVVTTTNTNEKVASLFLRSHAYGSAKNRVLTERFTRVGEGAMDYEFTIDDPDTFTDRVTAKMNLSKLDGQIYEFACHEGNYALPNMLRAARMEEQGAL